MCYFSDCLDRLATARERTSSLVKFKTSIIMFKAYHNELPGSFQEMFNLHVQIYETRHN